MYGKLVKDKKTNAVNNEDISAYHTMMAQRQKSKQLVAMQRDIDELKETVKKILEKIG